MKRLQGSRSVLGFLAGILLLVLMGSYQAQAAWTKSENSRVKVLEKKIRVLEEQMASQEVITIRYLTTSGSTKTVNDICPGYENLENKPSVSPVGRLMTPTDIMGKEIKDIYGKSETPSAYQCVIRFIAQKN